MPFPPIGGGLTRTFHLLRSLASRHEVVLAAFTYGERHTSPPFPVHLEPVPWKWSHAYLEMMGADPEAARRAFQQLAFEEEAPWFASAMDHEGMDAALERVLRTQFQLVLLEGTPLAAFLPNLPLGIPRVLDLFDVHTLVARRALGQGPPAEHAALAREAERTVVFERRAAQACQACLAVSDGDAAVASTLLGAERVEVVPNGVDTSYFAASSIEREAGALLFTGRMSYPPNADAAAYFAEDILPLVRREIPFARFHVVGTGPPPRVEALASDAVLVHGHADDVRPYQRTAEVVVVPVREGGGTRLKVLEAAACGNAIVSTPLGVDGLPFRAGRDLLVADSAAEFAAAVAGLLRDPTRRAELGARARAVATRFEWSVIGASFRRTLEDIASR